MAEDILKTHVPQRVFQEMREARNTVVHITDEVTGAKMIFVRASSAAAAATAKAHTNRWNLKTWRGEPRA